MLIALLAIVAVVVIYYFSVNNREVALRKESDAQRGKIETVHDTMWKTLKQEAGVTEQYREAFEKIYPELISGRYSGDKDPLLKMITESNPEFDTSLYKHLMQSIDVQRAQFQQSQERMLDIIREHSTLLETIPAKWFLGSRPQIQYTVISSTLSKETMRTGIDDTVDLFK
ncbi:MAG: hypothetical protein MJY66_06355 [Bacteroidaceae bacterium]|nr:hypothetical protein [Bacteroidaceae bacterium]